MSLPRYAEYKDSGVEWLGQIPEHWGTLQSRRMFAVRSEPALPTDRMLTASQKYGVLFQADFMELEGRRVVEVIMGTDSLKHVEPDDFIISMRSFQGGIEWCQLRGSTSFHYVMLRPVKHVWPPYFAHLLKSPTYIQALRRTTDLIRDGQELRFSNFAQVDLPVVPLEEQKAIAVFLDRETAKIDALIAEQEKLTALLVEKRQATISHAVTKGLDPMAPMKGSGVAWLGEVPKHWDVVGLTKYLESVVDYRGRTPAKVDEGVFLVTAKNIRDGVIDYAASQEYIAPAEFDSVMRRGLPLAGDVLFTTEAPLGQVASVDREDIALAQRVIKFRADSKRLRNDFLKFWVMGSACQFNLEQLATGSTALGIKGSKIGQVRLCLPPLDEQADIVTHIESEAARLVRLKAEAEVAINLLKERRSALIAAAVTGQIDVRNA